MMNNSNYRKEELEDLLLNRIPREYLHQMDGIFCLATLFAFYRNKKREKLEKKKGVLVLNQEEEIQL